MEMDKQSKKFDFCLKMGTFKEPTEREISETHMKVRETDEVMRSQMEVGNGVLDYQ